MKKIVVVVFVVLVGGLAWFVWNEHQETQRINRALSIGRRCTNIDEALQVLGVPYEVTTRVPPKLGAHLITQSDDPENIAFYLFTIQKMPPVFLVIKVEKHTGKILAVGTAKS